MKHYNTPSEYFNDQTIDIQEKLDEIKQCVFKVVPDALEVPPAPQ